MGVPPIGLDYLSVFGMRPGDFVRLTARAGYDAVGLNLGGASNRLAGAPRYDLRDDPSLRRELGEAVLETRMAVSLVEGFPILPQADVGSFDSHLDWIATLGAKAICAVSLERDRARSRDQFALLTEMARARGLLTTTEVGAGILRDLDRTVAMVRSVADPDFRLLVDTMHFFRSGSTVDDFAGLDREMIGYIQLCDVPMPALNRDYMDEALHERMVIGDGDLPLRELARVIPDDLQVALEIPVRSQLVDGAPTVAFLAEARERAQRLWLRCV